LDEVDNVVNPEAGDFCNGTSPRNEERAVREPVVLREGGHAGAGVRGAVARNYSESRDEDACSEFDNVPTSFLE